MERQKARVKKKQFKKTEKLKQMHDIDVLKNKRNVSLFKSYCMDYKHNTNPLKTQVISGVKSEHTLLVYDL